MDAFEWKPVGESWKGVGIYLLTCVVADRRPLLGSLAWDGQSASISRTWLGNAVVEKFLELQQRYPQVRCLAFQVMPDHFHGVLYVREELPVSIRMVVRGFRQGCSKRYRESMGFGSGVAVDLTKRDHEGNQGMVFGNEIAEKLTKASASVAATGTAGQGVRSRSLSVTPQSYCGTNCFTMPGTLFTDYHLRSLAHKGQLRAMIDYVHDNPRRLAAKRVHADFFRVRRNIRIGEMTFDAVGNMQLLKQPLVAVHCRRVWNDEETRAYQNRCILSARNGAVLVGAFISKAEKAILDEAHKECLPVIHLLHNGFHEMYKPSGLDFDACVEGRLLQLAPWPFVNAKSPITRQQCERLNAMAEALAVLN